MRAPPPDLSKAASSLAAGGMFLLGACLPLLLSGMIPNGMQRWAAAVFCLIGIAVLIGIGVGQSTPFNMGLGTGLCLASIKLATGLRFL